MTPHDRAVIRAWSDSLGREVSLLLLATADARSRELARFCDALAELAPRCRVDRQTSDTMAPPAIAVGRRVRLCAVPTERELEPCLAMLAPMPLESSRLDRMAAPPSQQVTLYVAPTCPHCPQILGALVPRMANDPELGLEIIDAALFADLADRDRVSSVPTLIVDQRLRVTGSVGLDELGELVGPASQYSAKVSRRLLSDGNVDALAQILSEFSLVPAWLAELASDETFSVRLAAMTLVEQLADRDRQLAERLAEPLWARFESTRDPVRGDLIYLLGQVGTARLLPRLQMVARGDDDGDVREAARDAIEALAARQPDRAVP